MIFLSTHSWSKFSRGKNFCIYRTARKAVGAKFSMHCDSSHGSSRMKTLKSNLGLAKDMLINGSGFGYNQSKHMIEAAAGVWEAYLEVYVCLLLSL
ncbi:unnamed protein product [Camellia sinensis]